MNKFDEKNLGSAFDIDTGKEKWKSQELNVNSDPLIDPGTGRPVIIRSFEFQFDPAMLQKLKEHKIHVPSDQELFNSVWPQIRIMLWGDGLVARQEAEFPPKIKIGRKKFKVVLVCDPKFGRSVDDVHSLNEYLKR